MYEGSVQAVGMPSASEVQSVGSVDEDAVASVPN